MNDCALNVSSRLLSGVNKTYTTDPVLFEILGDTSDKSYTGPIGVSTLCSLPLESDYQIFMGQDDSLSDMPIVAVDSKFNPNFTKSTIIS